MNNETDCPKCGSEDTKHDCYDDGYEGNTYWTADYRTCNKCGHEFVLTD